MKITWNYFTVYDEVLIIHNARETLYVHACKAETAWSRSTYDSFHYLYIEMDYVHRSNL